LLRKTAKRETLLTAAGQGCEQRIRHLQTGAVSVKNTIVFQLLKTFSRRVQPQPGDGEELDPGGVRRLATSNTFLFFKFVYGFLQYSNFEAADPG
jgi:hypothetical protein